jgi:hypothetical protein
MPPLAVWVVKISVFKPGFAALHTGSSMSWAFAGSA